MNEISQAGDSVVPSAANGSQAPTLSGKLQRGDLMAAACPSREILRHLTSRWGVLILIALLPGTQRFSDLRRGIGGVSERMLAQTLQWLEADGIVARKAYKVVPPHVEYSLTPLGHEAAKHVQALADWIEVNLGRMTPAIDTQT
ncbi:helix-turn-helix transcriptional regulator [Pusillimonas sp. CC-YST705]|uniref:Helix-turn-helix transcriptional regulator n=2 Tax=Mesopusillimonas faecipullorum TaxID=2755040 RepID=A0ABS8CEU8_9BURK|nr:helix-turn-helix transcriptional regulator [Mesopusillimonas faecipullorum]